MSWGVRPAAMIGHSIGEYVAACLAGVFTLEDALAVVAVRARLMQAQAPGAMIAVRVPEHRMVDLLNENLALAAVNAPGLCVVSGPFDAIEALEKRLAASAIPSRRLATSHAFHSPMMEPAVRPFAEHLRGVRMNPPRLPWVSNLTGKWIRADEATSADYWASHLRRAVRFADGVAELLAGEARVLLEVGPGHTLAGLARQHPAFSAVGAAAVSTLGEAREGFPARAALLHACGQLWAAGAGIDWRNGLHRGQRRAVVTLPTYPFERRRHWIEPGVECLAGAAQAKPAVPVNGKEPVVAVVAAEPATPEGNGTLDAVRELLRELSGVDIRTAGEGTTFYQLGFDSLFLSQVSRQIAERFGTEVSFRQLREEISTPRKLADHLDRAMTGQTPRAAGAETPAAVTHERRLPLTDAQREIWFASQLGAAMSSAYAESTILRLRGGLDRAALERAAQALVERHEALRMTISAAGDEAIVAPTAAADVQWREFSAGDEAAARRYLADEIHAPFDLICGPLFRVRIAQLAAREHLVAVAAHHIVCDGWSLGVLVRELAKLHSASGSSAVALPPAPSFVEHAVREQAVRATETFAAAERFWTGQFADGVPAFDVPTDRPRPAERTHAGGFVVRTLPAEVTAAVKQLCAAKSCTPFTALFAAFAVLMHRLSGQDDIVVGVPSSAQAMDGVESLVGHFANLLPLRSRWRDDQPFAEFLGETSRRLNSALEHWRYPFGALLQKLNLARDGGRVPLAPIVFNTTRRRDPLHFAGLEAEVTDNPKRFVNFDLNFNFALADDALSLGCYFSTELFDEATILRWFGHLETLLRDIARDAGTAVGDLALLSAAERRQMLVEWNDTALDYPRDACIAELFEAQARQTPDAVAIVHGHERVTYRELDAAADAVAARLRTAGVGPDTLVGLLLGRTPRLLAAIFGVLKAGGAYVPLDPQYPAERLAFIAGDTRMPVLVTERGLVDRQPGGNYTTLLIDELEGDAAPMPENPPAAVRPGADSLAYVIYTSGSTGEPKGVAIVQRCVVALVAWARQLYRREELDGVLFATSASFDISVFEIFCPLCLGGKIVLAENILELASLPAAGEVRFLSGTPSALAEVVRLDLLPRSVTTVALAGEAFPQPLVDALYRRPHIQRVYELYGPTETTVYSTGSLRKPHTRPTLGRPFPNERIYIVDRRLQPVPIGVTGEICIGGDKLARGYLHRPELTASRFITAPFANGERVYRSGDLGRWLADGTIESTGRADHQVKVRGHRVELGEIELALARHLAVRECVVIARPDSGGNNRLLAYVVPAPGARIDGATLREHLRKKLPAHAVPSAVVLLERMPLTENRKLDRAALPEPDFAAAAGEFVAPRTETEEIVAGIWRDVLAVARVGTNDNFFELGGHSLLATQVIARANDVLGVELDLAQFFATPTIAGLAAAIEQLLVAQIKAAPPSETMAGEDLALAK
jgi:amino acid adenylation domain-containing protein